MAKKKASTTKKPASAGSDTPKRYKVLFREKATEEGKTLMTKTVGVRSFVHMADAKDGGLSPDSVGDASTVCDVLGVSIVTLDAEQHRKLCACQHDSAIQAIEPERIMYTLGVSAGGHDHPQSVERSAD